jgi:hypothetical protein
MFAALVPAQLSQLAILYNHKHVINNLRHLSISAANVRDRADGGLRSPAR